MASSAPRGHGARPRPLLVRVAEALADGRRTGSPRPDDAKKPVDWEVYGRLAPTTGGRDLNPPTLLTKDQILHGIRL